MKRILIAAMLSLLGAIAPRAAGGTCPSGANYLSASMDAQKLPLVTLSSLGVTNCYFIAASGSDSNTGTDEAQPWAHSPGMPTCTANCAAITPAPGQGFIFRGGDSWASANFKITWNWSGDSSNPIYIGVDATWFSGSSWARPIWICPDGCWYTGTNRSYEMLDNFEMTGLLDAGSAPNYVNMFGTYQLVENLYIHGWSTTRSDNSTSQAIRFVSGSDGHGDTMRYNVIDGSDTAKNMLFVTFQSTPIAYGNIIRYVYTGLDGCGDDWHDNLVEYSMVQGVVTGHQDGLYHVSQCYRPNSLIYNNVVRHTPHPLTAGAVKLWINGNSPCPFPSCTSYMFNNLIYDNYPGNTFDTGGHFAQNYGTWYIFNNTIQCGTDKVQGDCSELSDVGNTGGTMTLIRLNNHYISTGGLRNNCTHYTCSQTHDLVQTLSRAKSQGYTSKSSYAFQPTKASGSTVGTGANLSSLCTAVSAIDASAGTACGTATGYACSYNSTNHTVSCPALTPVSRGSTWDKGAYEYNDTPPVATPTFSPAGGTYSSSQSVTISVASPSDSAILYCQDTTNACTPTTNYSSPVSVAVTGYLRASATHSGYNNSGIASGQYQIGSTAPGNVVQHRATRCASGMTCAVAFVNSVTAGDYILAAGWDATGKNLSVTFSDGSNSYNQVTFDGNVYCSLNTDLDTLGVSYAVASSSGPVTVTMADSANHPGTRIVEIAEVSGLAGLDKAACANPTGTSINSGNTATTAQANEFLFGFMGNNANNVLTLSAGPGYTGLDVVANGVSGYNCVYDEYQSVTSAGAYAATFSQSVSEEAAVVVATFSIGGSPAVSLTPISATFTTNQNTTSANQTATLQKVGNADLTVTADGTTGYFPETQLEPVLQFLSRKHCP